jgi:hypothetical protein
MPLVTTDSKPSEIEPDHRIQYLRGQMDRVKMTGTCLGMGFMIRLRFSSKSAMLVQGLLSLLLEGIRCTEVFPDKRLSHCLMV